MIGSWVARSLLSTLVLPHPPANHQHDGGMAEGILSFPFRLTPQGQAAVTPYRSDAEVDEAIAVLSLTNVGERLMEPSFGIPDPVFSGISQGDVQVGLDAYGPAGVTITSVTTEPATNTQVVAEIMWAREDQEEQ